MSSFHINVGQQIGFDIIVLFNQSYGFNLQSESTDKIQITCLRTSKHRQKS